MSGPVRGTEPAMLTQTAAAREGADAMDMKLEVVTIPVSDVSRAREFYASLGWRLDTTPPVVVQQLIPS